MGLVRRIFSGKVVSRSSGSVSGKKKLLQFFFAGFCFSERWLFFRFLQPIPIMSNQDLLGEGGYVGCGSSISGVQAKQMGEMVSVSGVLRRNYRWFRLRRRCFLGAGRGGVTR
ncbi:unnamed protein product [Brassica oleracea]